MLPKKSLGQNFLKNSNKLKKLAAALDLQPGDFIIEIGPGYGALTQTIFKNQPDVNLTAIEKDARLIPSLLEKFSKQNFHLIEGDILDALPKITHHTPYKLIGNIPYYITGRLLRLLSEIPIKPILTVLTVQKEVGERLISLAGRFNRLAAFTSFWGQAEIISSLPRLNFSPPPKVDSVAVKITSLNLSTTESALFPVYERLVLAAFKQPRKTLANNLSSSLNLNKEEVKYLLDTVKLSFSARPQDLSRSHLMHLSHLLK